MRLERMGSAFQTRISFMRSLVRRMHREAWTIEQTRFDLDDDGFGVAVYTVCGPERSYSLVAFANPLDDDQRTDRVIAEAWDASFVLYDGVPSDEDIARLALGTPGRRRVDSKAASWFCREPIAVCGCSTMCARVWLRVYSPI